MAKAAAMPSKSELIRQELRKSRKPSPKAIAAKLTEQGIEVTAAYVSNIKNQMKKKRGRGRRGRPSAAAAEKPRTTSVAELKKTSEALLQAVELVLNVGPKESRELIAVAERLVHLLTKQR